MAEASFSRPRSAVAFDCTDERMSAIDLGALVVGRREESYLREIHCVTVLVNLDTLRVGCCSRAVAHIQSVSWHVAPPVQRFSWTPRSVLSVSFPTLRQTNASTRPSAVTVIASWPLRVETRQRRHARKQTCWSSWGLRHMRPISGHAQTLLLAHSDQPLMGRSEA